MVYGAVVVVCGTYLLKGDSLSFGVREGFNIERNISTKLDVQFNQLLLRFSNMENDLKRLDTDIKNWESRIRRLEEIVETGILRLSGRCVDRLVTSASQYYSIIKL